MFSKTNDIIESKDIHRNKIKSNDIHIISNDNIEIISINNKSNDENQNPNESKSNYNRTLKVGPNECGKTHLLNKLQLMCLVNPEKQITILTRSPKQYENTTRCFSERFRR